jgi:hypothetical protein
VSQVPDWRLEAIEMKPDQLEIAYGEFESEASGSDFNILSVVVPEMMGTASQLSIATSSSETGELTERKKHTVRYQISKNAAGSFDLKIYTKTFVGGLWEVNTDVTLKESEWVLISCVTQQTTEGTS